MQPADRKNLLSCLMGCAEVYGKEISESVARVWWDLLKHYDIEAVQAAFAIHMSDPDTGQFMPKPADVVRRMNGTSQDSALRAWALVDKGVRQVGTWASVTFDDPLIMTVLTDMGGWIAMGEKSESEWPFVAKQFENRYRGYKQRGELPEHPARLCGISEAQNTRSGFKAPPPILIGDAAKAARVLAAGGTKPVLRVVQSVADLAPKLLAQHEASRES